MTTTTEPDLFRGYEPSSPGSDPAALGQVVLDRIHDLIGYRRWYRSHVGWLVDSHREDMTELRLLLGLRRRARRQAPDPVDAYKAAADRGLSYHDVQAEWPDEHCQHCGDLPEAYLVGGGRPPVRYSCACRA